MAFWNRNQKVEVEAVENSACVEINVGDVVEWLPGKAKGIVKSANYHTQMIKVLIAPTLPIYVHIDSVIKIASAA